MASGGIWGMFPTSNSNGGMTPDRYQNHLLSKGIHTIMFPSFAAYNCVLLDSTMYGFGWDMGNMFLTPYSSGGTTPDRYHEHLLSKVRYTIMFPSLAA